MGPKSAYEVLGVASSASPDQIRRAYRARAKDTHPDRAGDAAGASDAFLAVRVAYELLMDPARRAAYDACPGDLLEDEIAIARRRALRRRRKRLMRLYE